MKIGSLTQKWQHKDASIRLRAVQAATLDQEILIELGQSDPDFEVRRTAILQINDPTVLRLLADDVNVNQVATSRWAAILGSDLANFDKINENLPEFLLIRLVTEADQPDIRYKAASLITNQTRLEEILFTPNHSRVHQLCASNLDDETKLEQVHKHYLDKDKNVARIVKSKLQAIKKEREQVLQFETELSKTLDAIEKLADSENIDGLERRLSVLNDKWASLKSTCSADHQDRYNKAQFLCQQLIDESVALKGKPIEEAKSVLCSLRNLTEKFRGAASDLETLSQSLSAARNCWPKGQDMAPFYSLFNPLENLHNQFEIWSAISKELASLHPEQLTRRMAALQWPEGFAEPDEIVKTRMGIEEHLTQIQKAKTGHRNRIKEVEEKLNQLESAITDGHLKQANRLRTSIKNKFNQFPAPQRLLNRSHLLATKLNELRDWQDFVTNPKREELCIGMDKLANDLSIHPREKARAIKELQDQWKKLGPSNNKQAQRLWTRFRKLGNLAFEPCGKYFESQKKAREQNFTERKKICASLELFLEENDWQKANWKLVVDIINKSRQEWHQYSDIPRSNRKKIQDRFNRVLDGLQEKLKSEFSRNQAKKSALIEEMRGLTEIDVPIKQATAQARVLQTKWKDVGVTDRYADRKLWKQFRTECDKVFNRRDEKLALDRKKQNETADATRSVLNSFDDLLKSDQAIHRNDINSFKKQFNAISQQRNQSSIRNEFQRLIKSAETILSQQAQTSKHQMIAELKRLSELCNQFEIGKIDAATLDVNWQSEVALDKKFTKRINLRREGSNKADPAEAEKLCIQLEILAGIESPPESAQARMAYQVERLNREFSQGNKQTISVEDQSTGIQVSWYCLPSMTLNDELNARFQRAEAVLGI